MCQAFTATVKARAVLESGRTQRALPRHPDPLPQNLPSKKSNATVWFVVRSVSWIRRNVRVTIS